MVMYLSGEVGVVLLRRFKHHLKTVIFSYEDVSQAWFIPWSHW